MNTLKHLLLLGVCALGFVGCATNPTVEENDTPVAQCGDAYLHAFFAAIDNDDASFCLAETPDPEFVDDELGGFCFVPENQNSYETNTNTEKFFTLNEQSPITDCVNNFAKSAQDISYCDILDQTDLESNGLGTTAKSTCVIGVAIRYETKEPCASLDEENAQICEQQVEKYSNL